MAGSAEVEWRKLRADQLREMARADAIVILPVASLEQHGPHLPVEVDCMLGETVAARAARKIAARGQQALVLPVMWTGLSEHHMSFGGTITLDFPAFTAVVEGVVPLGAAPRVQAHRAAERAWRQRERAAHHHRRADAEARRADRAVHLLVRGGRGDRGDPGDTVRADARLRGGDLDDAGGAAGAGGDGPRRTGEGEQHAGCRRCCWRRRVSWRTIGARSSSGVIGNPEAATAEKGERLFEAIATALADKLCNVELWELPWQA